MNEIEHYYQILGLQPGATEAEVREAYRTLVKVWHPDRFSGDPRLQEKAQEKLKEINAAYKWVLDYMAGQTEPEFQPEDESEPSTHHEHDHPGSAPPPPPEPPSGPPPPGQSGGPRPSGHTAKETVQKPRPVPHGVAIMLSIGGFILNYTLYTTTYLPKCHPFLAFGDWSNPRFLLGFLITTLIPVLLLSAFSSLIVLAGCRIIKSIRKSWPSFVIPSIIATLMSTTIILVSGYEAERDKQQLASLANPSALPHSPTASPDIQSPPAPSAPASPSPPTLPLAPASSPEELVQSYCNRGRAYAGVGRYDQAIEDYTSAIAIHPGSYNAYFNRATAYMRKNQLDEAISDLNKAVSIDPNSADAYFCRGMAYDFKGMHQAAVEDFSRAISLSPNSADLYVCRGRAYILKGTHQAAVEDFNKAIALNPNSADAYYARGDAYLRLGRQSQAIKDWKTAARLGSEPAQKTLFEMGEKW